MKDQVAGNYLRTHRKKAGLTQREMGKLLGFSGAGQVSRHERSRSVPTLRNALAYESVFRVPVAEIFFGIRAAITRNVENELQRLEAELQKRNAEDRDGNAVAQKLVWLTVRKSQ
jgi:transcriptional regulator with XRE-family HTH domain